MRCPDRGGYATDPVLYHPVLERLEIRAAGRHVPARNPLDDELTHELFQRESVERLVDPAAGVGVETDPATQRDRYGDGG